MKPKKLIIKKNLNSAKELYKEWEYIRIDKLITREFKMLKNNNLRDLYIKIKLIDNFYNCNLRKNRLNYRKLALLFLENKINDILIKKSNDAVTIIYELIHEKFNKHPLVFISKFCHFEQPNKFPMIDRFTRKALSDITERPIYHYKKDYNLFKKDLEELIEFLNIKLKIRLDYKTIDMYLWLYGQYLSYLEKGDKDFSEFTKKLFVDKKDLFEDLIPSY